MRKSDELGDPASCLNRAEPGEMVFVLLGHDVTSPKTIRFWCGERARKGKNQWEDTQIKEALACADTMEAEYMRAMYVQNFGADGEQYCFADTSAYQWQPRIDPHAQAALWKACTVCGDSTPMACSDCAIDFGRAVHVCGKAECRKVHAQRFEAKFPPMETAVPAEQAPMSECAGGHRYVDDVCTECGDVVRPFMEQMEYLRSREPARYEGGAARSKLTGRRDLIPAEAINAMARRLEIGAARYGENNWRRGGEAFRLATINHLQKHLSDYIERGNADEANTDALITNAAFLCEYERLKPYRGARPSELAEKLAATPMQAGEPPVKATYRRVFGGDGVEVAQNGVISVTEFHPDNCGCEDCRRKEPNEDDYRAGSVLDNLAERMHGLDARAAEVPLTLRADDDDEELRVRFAKVLANRACDDYAAALVKELRSGGA